VEFLDRPMSQDPHDQLLLQIRGAVAEYERTLIAERLRRGRQQHFRAGTLLRLYASSLWLSARSRPSPLSGWSARGGNRGRYRCRTLRHLPGAWTEPLQCRQAAHATRRPLA
jgi:hypothetical protein